MSNQGNIVVMNGNTVIMSEANPNLIFTTTRWGGAHTPEIARVALKAALKATDSTRYRYEFICSDLSHDNQIDRPIPEIGNCDSPTVVIDFIYDKVYWRREYNEVILKTWTFEEYVLLNFNDYSNPDYVEYYLD